MVPCLFVPTQECVGLGSPTLSSTVVLRSNSRRHRQIEDINRTQHTLVAFPIIADADRNVTTLYDLIPPNASTGCNLYEVSELSIRCT